jgi:hypothetical protein
VSEQQLTEARLEELASLTWRTEVLPADVRSMAQELLARRKDTKQSRKCPECGNMVQTIGNGGELYTHRRKRAHMTSEICSGSRSKV